MNSKIKSPPSITLDSFDLPRTKIEAIMSSALSQSNSEVNTIKPAARLAIVKAASDFVLYITDAAIGPQPLPKSLRTKVAKEASDDKKLTDESIKKALIATNFTKIVDSINC